MDKSKLYYFHFEGTNDLKLNSSEEPLMVEHKYMRLIHHPAGYVPISVSDFEKIFGVKR